MKPILFIAFVFWLLFCSGCKGYRWVAVDGGGSNWYANPNERHDALMRNNGIPSEEHSSMLLHTKQITLKEYNKHKRLRPYKTANGAWIKPHTESREADSFIQLFGLGILENAVK